MKLPLAIILLCISSLVFGYQKQEIELDSGVELSLTRFDGEGQTLVLWLPSEHGLGQGYLPVGLNLSARGFDVWVAHLHESYMLPTGRYSLDEIDASELMPLVEMARLQGFEDLFFLSANRGVQLAIKMAYLWQQQDIESSLLKGHLFFSPHLAKGRTELGQQAEYLELAAYSNLPIYLMQAQYSTKYAHSWSIAEQLQRGGSPVYLHFIPGVQGGFQSRPEVDLTEDDIDQRGQLGAIVEQAISLLRVSDAAPLRPGYRPDSGIDPASSNTSGLSALQPFRGSKKPPRLALTSLSGQKFDLNDLQGKVVLVNFWATWCGPCVREIPSLSRLVDHMHGKPFEVVAVNIGESADSIRRFLDKVSVNFKIVLDSNGSTVRDWNVYAYPSNFLIDTQGNIQYAYRGALEWDDIEVVAVIESLFHE